jgi:hypothetical protein
MPQPTRSAVPPALVALVAPDSGMERQARIGGVRLAFLIAFACAVLAAFGQSWKVDAKAATLKKLEQAGQLATISDRQLQDDTRSAERIYQVARVAQGLFEAPVNLGLGCLAVLGLCWFLRGKAKGRAVAPVAAAVLLPGAIANLLDAVTALQHPSLPPEATVLAPRNLSAIAAAFGHPLAGPFLKLGNAFDFFSLWAAVLMGFGVAAAGELPTRRAIIVTLAAWVCLRLLTSVAMGGP